MFRLDDWFSWPCEKRWEVRRERQHGSAQEGEGIRALGLSVKQVGETAQDHGGVSVLVTIMGPAGGLHGSTS